MVDATKNGKRAKVVGYATRESTARSCQYNSLCESASLTLMPDEGHV